MLQVPEPSEYAAFYGRYIDMVKDRHLLDFYTEQVEEYSTFLLNIPAETMDHRYEPGKWSIREVFTHVNDVERIFGYRMLCTLRGETNAMAGFDQDSYISDAKISKRSQENLNLEFKALRNANHALISSVEPNEWLRQTSFSGNPMSARALAYMIPGHLISHIEVLQERYL